MYKREIKRMWLGKENVKLFFFISNGMILHRKDPKDSVWKLLQLINTQRNLTSYKVNSKNQLPPPPTPYVNDKIALVQEQEDNLSHQSSQP